MKKDKMERKRFRIDRIGGFGLSAFGGGTRKKRKGQEEEV